MIYFDNASTTKVDEDIFEKMLDFSQQKYGNLESIHKFSISIKKEIEEKKKIFEKIFGKEKELFHFTSGGGEGNNICLTSVMNYFKKGHIITTDLEHPSVSEVLKKYGNNFEITYISPKLEKINFEMIKDYIREDTVLISLTSCNSELGIIYDIDEVSKKIKEVRQDIYIHTDFVQALGHKKINLENIDLLTISSHKIHGPKGVGAIYINKNLKLKSNLFGKNTYSGIIKRTLPNESIYGFLLALEKLYNVEEEKYILKLKEYAITKLKEEFKNNIYILENDNSKILSFSIKNLWSEILFNYLSENNIYISVGAACSKGVSDIIKTLNLAKEYEKGMVRLSFSKNNKIDEIDEFIEKMKEFKKYMR